MHSLKQHIVRTTAAWVVLLVFLGLFQPDKLPVVGLIVPFMLLFAALYSLWNLLYLLRQRYFMKNATAASTPRRLGIVICLCSVVLLIVQSLGQLTLRDVLTVVAILVVAYLYFSRNRSSAS